MYAIGDPETEAIDSEYESCEAAEVAAIEKSIDDHVWAVWANEGGKNNPSLLLVSLVFHQQVFTS